MAVERPSDSVATANRSTPSSTPAASSAGAPPSTALSGGSAAAADGISSPSVKPVVPDGPYLGRQDLAAEDKIQFFDCMAGQVWYSFVLAGWATLPMGVAPEAASNHL